MAKTEGAQAAWRAIEEEEKLQESYAMSAGPEFKGADAVTRKEYARIRRNALDRRAAAIRMSADEWTAHMARRDRKKTYRRHTRAEHAILEMDTRQGGAVASGLTQVADLERAQLREALLRRRLADLRTARLDLDVERRAARDTYRQLRVDKLDGIAQHKRAIAGYDLEYADDEAADVARDRCGWVLRKTAAAVRNLEALRAAPS